MKYKNIPGTKYKIVYCDKFQELLLQATNYEPLKFSKQKIERFINNEKIIAGFIELNVWDTIVSFMERYAVKLSYAFYDPIEDYIFINLPALGIKVSSKCEIYTKPNTTTYQFLANVIAHETIHYIFQHYTSTIFQYIKKIILKFYNTYWSYIFDNNMTSFVANANFMVGLDMNINIIDKNKALIAKNNMLRFIQLLEKYSNHPSVKDKDKLTASISIMKNILVGKVYSLDDDINYIFNQSYMSIYNAYSLDMSYGQELVFSSEILARSTDIKSTDAMLVTRRLLSALGV